MKNDNKIKQSIKTIQHLCSEYLAQPNPCAYTDSLIDLILKQAEDLHKLHEKNK